MIKSEMDRLNNNEREKKIKSRLGHRRMKKERKLELRAERSDIDSDESSSDDDDFGIETKFSNHILFN